MVWRGNKSYLAGLTTYDGARARGPEGRAGGESAVPLYLAESRSTPDSAKYRETAAGTLLGAVGSR